MHLRYAIGLCALLFLLAAPLSRASMPLYVSQNNGEIYSIDLAGNSSLFATVPSCTHGDLMAIDLSGNLYVGDSDSTTVYRIDSLGNVSSFATGLNQPLGLAFNYNTGDLYVAE